MIDRQGDNHNTQKISMNMKDQVPIEKNEETELSIIIVNYNTREFLKQCLTSLFESEFDLAYEVIVVDNASSDGSSLMVKKEFPSVIFIENEKNEGFSKANNIGTRTGQGRYFLFLNPDTVVPQGSLEIMVNFIKSHPEAGIIGPQLVFPDGSLQLSCRRFYTISSVLAKRTPLGQVYPFNRKVKNLLMSDWDHFTVREVDWVLAACLMISRELFNTIANFDEKYKMYFEDVDLCFRVSQKGYKIYYVPQARIIHYHQRESARGFNLKTVWHIRSFARYYRKHWFHLLKKKLGK